MGCGESTENTKHSVGYKHQKKTKQVVRGESSSSPQDKKLDGLGPHDGETTKIATGVFVTPAQEDDDQAFGGGNAASPAENPFAPWGGDQDVSPRNRRGSGAVSALDRDSSPMRAGSPSMSPRRGSRRNSANPCGSPGFGDIPAMVGDGSMNLNASNNAAAHGAGGRRRSSQHGSLSPMLSPTNRRGSQQNSALLAGNLNPLPMRSSPSSPRNSNKRFSVDTGHAVKSSLPLHPRSRVLPRKFNSRFDRHYKGQYRSEARPDEEILPPKQRVRAQDMELNKAQLLDDKVASVLNGTGLVWPVIGTNWRVLKFSSKDHHVEADEQTGDEDDDDLAPLCAIVDVRPTEQDSAYLLGLRLKKAHHQVTTTMEKIETMVQQDSLIISLGPVCHDLAVSCCRVGLMRLTSVFMQLSALIVDFQLLLSRKAGFLRALHNSSARHFEEEFTADVDLALPMAGEGGTFLVNTFNDEDEDSVVDDHAILSAFVDYLKGRFKSDIHYCVAVARALVDQNIDTRELDIAGLTVEEREALSAAKTPEPSK